MNVPTTPWGNPSTIFSGQISGIDCYFLTRHGKNHDKSPTQGNLLKINIYQFSQTNSKKFE